MNRALPRHAPMYELLTRGQPIVARASAVFYRTFGLADVLALCWGAALGCASLTILLAVAEIALNAALDPASWIWEVKLVLLLTALSVLGLFSVRAHYFLVALDGQRSERE